MNNTAAQSDIEEIVRRISPPSIPDESFANANSVLKEIEYWQRRRALQQLSGLQTDPSFHANNIRFDWLQRLIITYSNGKKKPSQKDLRKVLNQELEEANVLRLEDPIEDTFCDLIVTKSGNFRIILGLWESATAYTQTLLEAFEELPEQDKKKYHFKSRICITKT